MTGTGREVPLSPRADPVQFAVEPRRAAGGERPAGFVDRLPVGLALVGPVLGDATSAPGGARLPAGDRVARAPPGGLTSCPSSAVGARPGPRRCGIAAGVWIATATAATRAAGPATWPRCRRSAAPYARSCQTVVRPPTVTAYGDVIDVVSGACLPLLRSRSAAMPVRWRPPSDLSPRLHRLVCGRRERVRRCSTGARRRRTRDAGGVAKGSPRLLAAGRDRADTRRPRNPASTAGRS